MTTILAAGGTALSTDGSPAVNTLLTAWGPTVVSVELRRAAAGARLPPRAAARGAGRRGGGPPDWRVGRCTNHDGHTNGHTMAGERATAAGPAAETTPRRPPGKRQERFPEMLTLRGGGLCDGLRGWGGAAGARCVAYEQAGFTRERGVAPREREPFARKTSRRRERSPRRRPRGWRAWSGTVTVELSDPRRHHERLGHKFL